VNDEIRILIADDHPIVRKGLRFSIEEDPGLTVIGEASDGETALAMIMKLKPDVAILDIDMPKMDGLAVGRELAKQKLKTEIIFLTFHSDEDLFRAAVEIGSKGYILKDSVSQEIVAGVRAVAAGRPYLSSAITAEMLKKKEPPPKKAGEELTSRLTPTERCIMQLIAQGKSSKDIGSELSIHYRTVENHRTNICRKFALEGEGANALLRFALQKKDIW
jgi:DNA-binding NarL/FixJ family response regulator